jgi:hypothetical protein
MRIRRVVRIVAATVAATAVLSLVAPGRASASVTYNEIHSAFDGKCLDADYWAGGNGTKVQLWDCNGGNQQKWRLQTYPDPNVSGYYWIVNGRFGRCLNADNSAGSYPEGARVQLWDCATTSNMAWRIDYSGSYFELITMSRPDMVLDSDISHGDVNGMKAQMWWQFLNPRRKNQEWIFGLPVGDCDGFPCF